MFLIFHDGDRGVSDDRARKRDRLLQSALTSTSSPTFIDCSDSPKDIMLKIAVLTSKAYIICNNVDIKLFTTAVRALVKHCHISFGSSQLELVLVEDLVCTERSYIYNNFENNFFKSFLKFPQEYSNIITSITSSNVLLNSWGVGDTCVKLIPDINDMNGLWERVKSEVVFHEMFNQGNPVPRLVSIQSVYNDVFGRPLYRHPNDEEPPNVEMVPVVRQLMQLVEQYTGVTGLNHALVQHYRDGKDNIASHSDKTLDIDRHTPTINLSLGASRTMTIQNKQDKEIREKIPLRHGECVVFGLDTNRHWFHEVAKDVIMQSHPLYGTERISFTFRKIATFINDDGVIVGQGSPYKTSADIPGVNIGGQGAGSSDDRTVLTSPPQDAPTRADLIRAFGRENRESAEFDWEAVYGKGFLIR